MFKREFTVDDVIKFMRLSVAPDSMLRLASLVALANEFLDFEYPRGDTPYVEAMDVENWRDGLKAVGVVGDALNAWLSEQGTEVRREFIDKLHNEEVSIAVRVIRAHPRKRQRSDMWRWN